MAAAKKQRPDAAALLIIASGGGYAKGSAKLKAPDSAESAELAVEIDIQRAKRHWAKMPPLQWNNIKHLRHPSDDRMNGHSIYGELKCKGKAGRVKGIQQDIIKFFNDEASSQKYVYFTGHGNKKGDWGFPDGFITFEWMFEQIMKMEPVYCNGEGMSPDAPYCCIYADCCCSGVWARKLQKCYPESHQVFLYSAAKETCSAYDNQFSKIFGTFKSASSYTHLIRGFLPDWYTERFGGYRCDGGGQWDVVSKPKYR